ncbi:protein NEGATIVE REGULATOR OF RESISTANCE-like [Lolium rigidum]|uniref:protein NEGATIVE REGULATOR OF RESISTANCE-like n=1 Tax=Lolium rigidum TaxID=89674 RepID=UPI001F5C9156|nr:protein NEGATIVE REGULATOR OF RESISTANCE-like [Lolium rigidum]
MDAPTAAAKRKRPAADIAAATAAVEEVSDAEVEEFYAILRRMRDATRRFVSRGGGGAAGAAAGPVRAPAWRPSFSWEDFAPAAPPAAPPSQQQQPPRPPVDERVAENGTPPRRPAGVFLDLNAEPEPEAPTTPRPERVAA